MADPHTAAGKQSDDTMAHQLGQLHDMFRGLARRLGDGNARAQAAQRALVVGWAIDRIAVLEDLVRRYVDCPPENIPEDIPAQVGLGATDHHDGEG